MRHDSRNNNNTRMPCRKRSAHVLAFCVRDEACACVMSFSGRAKGTLPNVEAQGCRYRAKGTQHFATQAGGDHCATRTQGQEKLEPRVCAKKTDTDDGRLQERHSELVERAAARKSAKRVAR